jgi:hypothetical protein
MRIGMHHIDNYDWTISTSLLAFIISFVSNPTEYLSSEMSMVSLVSASVLCITGIIKLIDLILEKGPTWMDKTILLKEKTKNLFKKKD